jgi:RNA polymerase primary sigma factor
MTMTTNPPRAGNAARHARNLALFALLRDPRSTEAERKLARDEIILANQGLVWEAARAAEVRYLGTGLDAADFAGEANVGLIRAAELFDPSRGNRFSTYATYWVRQAVGKAVANRGSLVRTPVHVRKLAAVERNGGELTPKRRKLLDAAARAWGADRVPPEDRPSAEGPVGGELAEADEAEALRRALAAALATLDARERRVVEMRYGLNGAEPATLAATGAVVGVTRERVRQIQDAAVAKLRAALEGDKGDEA